MTEKRLRFFVPASPGLRAFKAQLKQRIPLEEEPPKNMGRAYFDSFDWRAYASGHVLEQEHWGEDVRLVWRTLDTGEPLATLHTETTPRFVWDLPDTPLRERLQPILEMRALLPQAMVRSRVHALRMLNNDEKTVVRVVMEDNRLLLDGGKTRRLGIRARVVPVKGYDRDLERVLGVLRDEMGLQAAEEDLMVAAACTLGRRPGGYSSKLDIRLEPPMHAGDATRRIMLNLLETLEINEAGTRADLDSEFLHDFRVAVRRTRSALSQIKGVLPERVLDAARADFAWLQEITGPTRDMDVYLLRFNAYRDSLPSGIRGDLAPLHEFLIARQQTEQRILTEQLGSARCRKLLRHWRTFLHSPLPEHPVLPNAARPVGEVANERIWRLFRRALKEGRAIGPESPAEELHELRKTCKKLRYLMEFFQSLYPPARIKRLIKVLKTLQENLGDFQDLEVQANSLRHFSEQMVEEGSVPAPTLMAMGILVEGLLRRQHAAREEFASRFAHFATPENRHAFEGLFAARTSAETA